MKHLLPIAAVLAVAGYAAPAPAAAAVSPAVYLRAFGPAHIAAVSKRAGCDAAAAIDGTPFLEVPGIAAQQGVTGTALVKIRLLPSGGLAEQELFASSGNLWLDHAAMVSARMTRYTAQTVDCNPVGGSYLYQVDF